jgi:adenylate cyclase class 2
MQTEYEATFTDVSKDDIRARLAAAGATLVKPEFLQKRSVFLLPAGHEIPGGWLRVRDEGDRVTMSLKVVDGDKIENQRETELVISDFAAGKDLLTAIGAREKAYQESRREKWRLGDVEVTVDEWPFLPPYVEVEGPSEAAVRAAAGRLGFDYAAARFCAVGTLYAERYGIEEAVLNDRTPRLVFEMENPFAAEG